MWFRNELSSLAEVSLYFLRGWEKRKGLPRRTKLRCIPLRFRSSDISNHLQLRANDARVGSWSCYNRRNQSGTKECCIAILGKKSVKNSFLLFLDILFPKTENKARCFLWRKSNPVVNYSFRFLEQTQRGRCHSKKEDQRNQKYVTASGLEHAMEGPWIKEANGKNLTK